MRPLVKICGLRRVADAELSIELGATHVGSVRAPASPRRAGLEEAKAIFEAARGRAETVVVFKDVPLDRMIEEAHAMEAGSVQLYAPTHERVRALASEGFRVLRVFDLDASATALPSLVPAPTPESPAVVDTGGGSGSRFDWSLLGEKAPDWTFVAGGVRAENIGELVRRRPYGVDLSSGVEESPGVKDHDELRRFFERFERAVEET